jgi:hypothetical protein
MSLYEYDLYLIREFDKGKLLDEIINSGLLQLIDCEEASIVGQVNCFFSEVINQEVRSSPLYIVKLELDDVQLEEVLQSNAQIFISWLQQLFKEHDIAYAFIGGGSYAAYYEEGGITSERVFKQVGHLIEMGTVEIVHPVMFFAQRLGHGKICEIAEESPYQVYKTAGVGCLLLLVSGNIDNNQIEILDPGNIYPRLRDHFLLKARD